MHNEFKVVELLIGYRNNTANEHTKCDLLNKATPMPWTQNWTKNPRQTYSIRSKQRCWTWVCVWINNFHPLSTLTKQDKRDGINFIRLFALSPNELLTSIQIDKPTHSVGHFVILWTPEYCSLSIRVYKLMIFGAENISGRFPKRFNKTNLVTKTKRFEQILCPVKVNAKRQRHLTWADLIKIDKSHSWRQYSIRSNSSSIYSEHLWVHIEIRKKGKIKSDQIETAAAAAVATRVIKQKSRLSKHQIPQSKPCTPTASGLEFRREKATGQFQSQ